MKDELGREINYLRVSVIDRCDLRCRYCMPEEGVNLKHHDEILSLEEIARLVKISTGIGVRKIRLTGGEPLIRRNIEWLVGKIGEMSQIDDIALTTNGTRLRELAPVLKEAGLKRVNISIDTLDPEKYRYITRVGDVVKVRSAIDAALEYGFNPVKLNVVAIRGFNDDEIISFARMAFQLPLHVRFIEFMPIGEAGFWNPIRLIKIPEIEEIISRHFNISPEKRIAGGGPARYYSIEGGAGTIGFISPMSNHFCSECNRLRLTAEGKLRGCLYAREEIDLKGLLRQGASDEEIRALFSRAVLAKPARHHLESGWGENNERQMYQIGG